MSKLKPVFVFLMLVLLIPVVSSAQGRPPLEVVEKQIEIFYEANKDRGFTKERDRKGRTIIKGPQGRVVPLKIIMSGKKDKHPKVKRNNKTAQENADLDKARISGAPRATFIMVHLEAGSDDRCPLFQEILKEAGMGSAPLNTKSLSLQKAIWPSVVKLVEAAQKYGHKLTLAINPQWAEYILQDKEKIKICRKWVSGGHEFAFHHHGLNHLDWNGYTNRGLPGKEKPEGRMIMKLKNMIRRGTVDDGLDFLQKLAHQIKQPDGIISGCITDTKCEKPDEVFILTTGSEEIEKDLLNKIDEMSVSNQKKMFWLHHFSLKSNFNTPANGKNYSLEESHQLSLDLLKSIQENYVNATSEQIGGIVFHGFDFHRMPDIYEQLFQWLASNGNHSITTREVVFRNAIQAGTSRKPGHTGFLQPKGKMSQPKNNKKNDIGH
ncbi:MAG: hypothetical protein ACQETH_12810 [Candidatus Rifleibacteriota bacterium]